MNPGKESQDHETRAVRECEMAIRCRVVMASTTPTAPSQPPQPQTRGYVGIGQPKTGMPEKAGMLYLQNPRLWSLLSLLPAY